MLGFTFHGDFFAMSDFLLVLFSIEFALNDSWNIIFYDLVVNLTHVIQNVLIFVITFLIIFLLKFHRLSDNFAEFRRLR